jgi:hypothetical protein
VRVCRESPRLAIATVLVAVIVMGGTLAVGSLLAGGDEAAPAADKQQVPTLTSRLHALERDLAGARGLAATQHSAQRTANRKLTVARRRSARKIRRLEHRLRRARRASR